MPRVPSKTRKNPKALTSSLAITSSLEEETHRELHDMVSNLMKNSRSPKINKERVIQLSKIELGENFSLKSTHREEIRIPSRVPEPVALPEPAQPPQPPAHDASRAIILPLSSSSQESSELLENEESMLKARAESIKRDLHRLEEAREHLQLRQHIHTIQLRYEQQLAEYTEEMERLTSQKLQDMHEQMECRLGKADAFRIELQKKIMQLQHQERRIMEEADGLRTEHDTACDAISRKATLAIEDKRRSISADLHAACDQAARDR